MDQARVLEHGERVEELRGKDLDELRAEALELVLLDELVQIRREQLEHEAQVVPVDERVTQTQDVVLVVRIALVVQLFARMGRCQGPSRKRREEKRKGAPARGW